MHNQEHRNDIRIPVGPQHPALKEPEFFSFKVEGERVLEADVRLGYSHRGIEKGCEDRNFIQSLYLVERICGICSHSHATVFIQGVEELQGTEIPKRAKYIRTIVGELERIHSHLLWVGVAAHEVGYDTMYMYAWRDREVVMDLLELVTGNRVNYSMNTLGGVRRDITKDMADKIRDGLKILEQKTMYYLNTALQEKTFIMRTENVGIMPTDVARKLGAAGPTARGSNIPDDVRKDDPYAAYGEIPFNVVTSKRCDVLGRAQVRVGELLESYKIIKYALDNIPDTPLAVKTSRRVPEGEVLSRYETPRGELIHYIKSNGTDKPERVKVRAPSLGNVAPVKYMLENYFIADIPIILAAIDPCFSCADRMVRVAEPDHEHVMTWEALSKFGIEWYKKNGNNI
ncbi:MAG: nickel-dependent hydrogenase large subunit [Candidatus Saganbacteria bacterium]|nr:nickel-dependent hydrogenase large subunit [Candidatus Saganbacteria bacterium]